MKDNKQAIEDFEAKANHLLDSLKAFAPSIDAMKELSEVELTDEAKAVVDQFTIDAKGAKDVDSLIKLKEDYLQKLDDARK